MAEKEWYVDLVIYWPSYVSDLPIFHDNVHVLGADEEEAIEAAASYVQDIYQYDADSYHASRVRQA